MQRESFLQWTRQQPFKPFRIVCSDGKTYDVRHPEYVMPTYSEVIVGIPDSVGVHKAFFLSYYHVTRLEAIDQAPAPLKVESGVGGG